MLFFHQVTLTAKVGEFPKKLSETEDFKESVPQGSPGLSKSCPVSSVQPYIFPQIALYSHSSSTPPNKSPLTALDVIKAPELGAAGRLVHVGSCCKPRETKSF